MIDHGSFHCENSIWRLSSDFNMQFLGVADVVLLESSFGFLMWMEFNIRSGLTIIIEGLPISLLQLHRDLTSRREVKRLSYRDCAMTELICVESLELDRHVSFDKVIHC